MKKSMLVLAAVLMLFCLSGCSGSREWNRPAGVIVVSGEVDAGDVSRISAEKNEGIYTFPLDAAMVYYFDAGDEQSFAGEQNVSSLQYSANIDTHTISAAADTSLLLEVRDGETIRIPYDWNDNTYAVNRLRSLLYEQLGLAEGRTVFLVFQYDRTAIYHAEYEMVLQIVQGAKLEASQKEILLSFIEMDVKE